MDKKNKKNTSKNDKSSKKSTSRPNDERPVKTAPKTTKPSYDLPSVQCKDTLLLDYDYNKQYSKRSVVNNWDKYAELPDNDDDDNEQLSAADFDQLLTASKAIGEHFTFAAERSWLHTDQSTDESPLAAELFKLNISNLNDGLSRLPFYLRNGLPEDMFTNDELTDMKYRSKFFDSGTSKKPQKENQANQNLLNILTSSSGVNQIEKNMDVGSVQAPKVVTKLPTENELAQTLESTQLSEKTASVKPAAMASTSLSATSQSKPTKTTSSNAPKTKSDKVEDIQDWLDDILNEN